MRQDTYKTLNEETITFLNTIRRKQLTKVQEHGSRWASEVSRVLTDMDVKLKERAYADANCLDIYLTGNRVVVLCEGPFSYYIDSPLRTATSKLNQRLLEAQGFFVVVVPYYEWNELKRVEDKHKYLWTLGRKAAEAVVQTGSHLGPPGASMDPEASDKLQDFETGAVLSDGALKRRQKVKQSTMPPGGTFESLIAAGDMFKTVTESLEAAEKRGQSVGISLSAMPAKLEAAAVLSDLSDIGGYLSENEVLSVSRLAQSDAELSEGPSVAPLVYTPEEIQNTAPLAFKKAKPI
eukprot:Platyproteum_vivax@DN3326_c0_g1_i2.p1